MFLFALIKIALLNLEAESLFLLLHLSLNRLVGPPHRLNLEQAVHNFQRDTASLGNEEEGKEEGEEG